MWRWLLSWQFTTILVVLAAAMSVGELVDAHFEGGREPWVAAGFYAVMALFYGWLSWYRYKHPQRLTVPPDRPSEPLR